jgi:hypothetical protein
MSIGADPMKIFTDPGMVITLQGRGQGSEIGQVGASREAKPGA